MPLAQNFKTRRYGRGQQRCYRNIGVECRQDGIEIAVFADPAPDAPMVCQSLEREGPEETGFVVRRYRQGIAFEGLATLCTDPDQWVR